MYSRIAILGLGLIGGSLWQRLTAHGFPVAAYDIDPHTREEARAHAATTSNRLADRVADTIPAAVVGADLAFVAVTTSHVPSVLRELWSVGYRGVLTDVTAIKEPLEELVHAKYPFARWVGGHPLVGFERAGYFETDSKIYDEAPWVLCLDPASKSSSALEDWLAVAEVLTTIGCRVVPMTAGEHDTVVARVDHLPHLVASALTQTVTAGETGEMALSLAGRFFENGSDAATTREDRTAEFCGVNTRALRRELDAMINNLVAIRERLNPRDFTALQSWLAAPNGARRAWRQEGQHAAEEPKQFTASVQKLLELGRAGGVITEVHGGAVTATRPASA